ncbi:GntR family transcriptional regulator [Streptomyces sp. NPDC046385]|uniref:GntR family transcriptional regulator n=1 Tax=Streptomyces sp. NPDC046385 TaxID=3154918 RepID=UPI0033F0016A
MTHLLTQERHERSNAAGERAVAYAHLRSALARVHGTAKPRPHRTDAETERDRQKIWALVEPWLARAAACRDEAHASPTDRARWDGLIAGVPQPAPNVRSVPQLGPFASAAASLLRALMDAETPGPSVGQIADHVRAAIKDGTYLPGTRLAAGRIVAEMNGARTLTGRAELAFQDLQSEGLVTRSSAGSWWADVQVDRPSQIATLLRLLIQARAYPPGDPLPPSIALARSLISSTSDVSAAVRRLRDEGSVVSSPGFGTRVCATPPFTVPHAVARDALISQLRTLTVSSHLSDSGIKERCVQAQGWWRKRISPPAAIMEYTRGVLIAAVLHLLPQVSHEAAADHYLRRAATLVFESADTPADRLWLTACLAAVVVELLAEREA